MIDDADLLKTRRENLNSSTRLSAAAQVNWPKAYEKEYILTDNDRNSVMSNNQIQKGLTSLLLLLSPR